MREFGDRLEALPELKAFTEQADALLAGGPSRFWECRPLFQSLLASRLVPDFLHAELARVAADPTYIPPGSQSEVDLLIFQTRTFSLFLRVLDPTLAFSDRIYGNTSHAMLGLFDFAGSGNLTLDHFEQAQPEPFDVFDRTKRLAKLDPIVLKPGQVAGFEAMRQIFRIVPVSAPVAPLVFTSASVSNIRWEYGQETLLPVRAIAAAPDSSRLDFAARLLSECGNEESLPPLKSLLDHHEHFVRWAAIRAIYRLDALEGVEALRRATDDPHPHVSRAAHRELARLSCV